MKRKILEDEIYYAKDYGEVGAGTVVPFAPKEERVPVILPKGMIVDPDMIGTMPVSGLSLNDEGIYDGDRLILLLDFTRRDIGPETICIVSIEATGGDLVAKKVLFQHGYVVLRSSGGGLPDKRYNPDDIEIKAIVIGYQRLRDPMGRLTRKPGDDDQF